MKNVNPDKLEQMLRDLPRTADAQMQNIQAGPHLKARIERAVDSPAPARRAWAIPQWLPAAACCMAALVLVLVFVPGNKAPAGNLINAGTLGGNATSEPVAAVNLMADLGDANVSISATRSTPGYRSIWASAKNGSFPLIGVNGKYYRMLTSPRHVDAGLMGETLGTISEFTTEPSLSGTDVVMSNVAAFGQPVHAIRGMSDTLVTAEVDGAMRLFQRVSFNGNARRGREGLEDTLQVRGRVIAMELSGVGTVTDAAACEQLLATLLDCASYESSGSISSKQSLLIELDNGLVVQLSVRSDKLAACGTWSCPEFFEEFEAACN